MKEKKIIDGINVAKCEFFKPKYHLNLCLAYETDEYAAFCENKPNCYFKQLERFDNEYEGFAVKYTDMEIALKRKEEELEILKVSYKTLLAEQTEIKKYLGISHKTILERLEELTDFRDADREQLGKLEAENKKLKKIQLGFSQGENLYNLYRYKYALLDIKEIANMCLCEDDMSKMILKKCEVLDEKV